MISYEEFKKIDLRIVLVTEASRVEGSDKLLRLSISLGDSTKQIIAGIGRQYEPEILIGKKIAIVANMEPRMLMGLESHGMVLAASGPTGPVLLFPEQDVPSGSTIG